ncbi:MAG: hypothetical protein IJT65_02400 [Eubacterium sp.]|nr:hypothetical protein [Eubacterium sp.]
MSNKVTILLSKYCDPFSNFIAAASGKYTHVSISVDPEENEFYSFNLKGFIKEYWHGKKSKYLLPHRKYIRINVSDEIFEKLKDEINKFEKRKSELSYTAFGTILCIMKIPHRFKKRYFCSQFVAEVLEKSGALKLTKKATLYLPMHFLKELNNYA